MPKDKEAKGVGGKSNPPGGPQPPIEKRKEDEGGMAIIEQSLGIWGFDIPPRPREEYQVIAHELICAKLCLQVLLFGPLVWLPFSLAEIQRAGPLTPEETAELNLLHKECRGQPLGVGSDFWQDPQGQRYLELSARTWAQMGLLNAFEDIPPTEYFERAGLAPDEAERARAYYDGVWKETFAKLTERARQGLVESLRQFKSPTATSYLTPVFGYGLRRGAPPEVTKTPLGQSLIFLTVPRPKSHLVAQINLLDQIPEERKQEEGNRVRRQLKPFGLKVLKLIIRECYRGGGGTSCQLDIGSALDLLGYTRDPRGVHRNKNRRALITQIQTIARDVQINLSARIPQANEKEDLLIEHSGAILHVSATQQVWRVPHNKPKETGVKIADGVTISVSPALFELMGGGGFFTWQEDRFLAIDTSDRGHPGAVLLKDYFDNQWAIGWNQYHGTIRQPLKQILGGAGIVLPRRSDYRKKVLADVAREFDWMVREGYADSIKPTAGTFADETDRPYIIQIPPNHGLSVFMGQPKTQKSIEKGRQKQRKARKGKRKGKQK